MIITCIIISTLFLHRYRQRHTKHLIHHTTTPTSTTSIHISNQTSWALNFVSQFNSMPSKESVVPTVNSFFLSTCKIQSTSTTKSSWSSSSSSVSCRLWYQLVDYICFSNLEGVWRILFRSRCWNRRRQKKLGLLSLEHQKSFDEIKGRWKYFGKEIVPNSFHSAAWHYWVMWKIFCAANAL